MPRVPRRERKRSRDVSEPIYDFNNNSTYDGPDGDFNGVLCLDTSGRCSTITTTGISAENMIVMSGGTPAGVIPANGTPLPAIAAGSTASVSILFADLNDNPMPQGTTIAGTVAGTGITLGTPSAHSALHDGATHIHSR